LGIFQWGTKPSAWLNKHICVGIAICLFLASFTQPAFYVDGPEKDAWSSPIAIVTAGWLGLMSGFFSCIAWLANPLFIFGVILFLRNKKIAVFVGLLAILCAGSFLWARTIPLGESGMEATITEYKAGYWIWLASIVFLEVIMLIGPRQGTSLRNPISR